MHCSVINAEGMIWPLQTFIDSHGFERRPDLIECYTRYEGEVDIVDDNLRVVHVIEARHVDWHSVVAVKAGSAVCGGCGLSFEPSVDPIYATQLVRNEAGRLLRDRCYVFAVNSSDAEHCEDCQTYGDWDY